MTRSGSLIAIGMFGIVPFGLISVAVTTRYMNLDEFGQLSILIAISSVITLFGGVGFLQGAHMAAYGMADDGDGDGDFVEFDDEFTEIDAAKVAAEERRRLLASGFILVAVSSAALCLLVAVVGTLVVTAWAHSYSEASVLWLAASGWSSAIWRFAHQVPRMERRPGYWAYLNWLRPGLVVGGSAAALVAGLGISGVLAAMAIGTFITGAVALIQFRHCFKFSPRREDVSDIWNRGKAWIPLTIAVAVQSNGSILLLGALATPASVALFQVASRIAQLPTYFAEGFLFAWPAMERSPISIAAKDRLEIREYSASVFNLFFFSTLGLVVAICLFSEVLVRIAAPSYQAAAELIPIVTVSYAVLTVFRGLFRATAFPLRRYWFTVLHFLWVIPYAAVATVLIPWNPSYGVAIAQIVAGLFVCGVYLFRDRQGETPTPFQWPRLGLAVASGFVCVGVAQIAPLGVAGQLMLNSAALVLFPVFLISVGVISRNQLDAVWRIILSVVPFRQSKKAVRAGIDSLPSYQRDAVSLTLCQQRDPSEAAEILGVTRRVVMARVVRGLRSFAETGTPTPYDAKIGEYLFSKRSTIERDTEAWELHELGIDQLQLHLLAEASRKVMKFSKSRSSAGSNPAGGIGATA